MNTENVCQNANFHSKIVHFQLTDSPLKVKGSSATEEQLAVANEINQSIEQIRTSSHETLEYGSQIQRTADHSTSIAEKANDLARYFWYR